MKLVCFYDIEKYKYENRVFAPSVATVIDYIADSLHRIGEPVEIISPSETRNTEGLFPFRSEEIRNGVVLTQGRTRGYANSLLRIISKSISRLWLVKYLLKNTEKNEIVFFWDTPVLFEPLILFKKLDKKNVKIFYFASEIHQKILHLGKLKRKMEWKLFDEADMLFVSTNLLNNIINKNNKPSIVLHGTYEITKDYGERFNDGLIHVVYAGVINCNKGSSKAVEIASFLPDNYCINIIGYGKKEDIEYLENIIEQSNSVNKCKIKYDGLLSGEEYFKYLQKCDIGICSQDLSAEYNDSSFPSKILSYLSNGLRVVSVDLTTIRFSDIGHLIYYSVSDSAEDFSKAILEIDMSKKYDSREEIKRLDSIFVEQLAQMIKGAK